MQTEEVNEEFYEKIKEEARQNLEHKELMEDKEKNQEYLKEEELDNLKYVVGKSYEDIVEILRYYVDMREDYYSLVAVWIIGTYLHEQFDTYPYLFINAMRGSGKTRLLKVIEALSKNGELLGSLRESVLFRTAKGKTLCIDEFESINNKENQALRELLNACYKRGMKVKRMKRTRNAGGEDYVVEEFEPYTPICMANIWGLNEVLGDRSITMILEKSSNIRITRIMENIKVNLRVLNVKSSLQSILVQLCSYFSERGYIQRWNDYISNRYRYIYTLTTLTTHTTETTPILDIKTLDFFNKIHDTNINGRNLELVFPLYLISKFISEKLFEEILQTTAEITKERKDDEMTDSRDVLLIDYVSTKGLDMGYLSIKKITSEFRDFIGDDEVEERWINTKWIGRALKRLNLIRDKRRMKEGIEVTLNIQKAIEKIKIFRNEKNESRK